MLLPHNMSGTAYAGDRATNSTDTEIAASDVASTGIFSTEYRKHEDLKTMLDGNKDVLKLEAMKRIIGMIAKGKDASDLFPAVVKNVVSKNIEVKKLVYVYLVRYAEEQQDLALLSISTFQRALKDPNQLIRASALRVLSSIRVPVIVPIMMLAIRDAVNDMSPYVRKTAAHAIPKLYSLDPEQKDQLIEVLEKLLSDKTTLVMGSAVMAFEEVCPDRIDLIHKNYRKLCNLLVDVEEWGQVVIMNMLTRYARTQFADPNKYDNSKDGEEKPFYESDNSHSKDEDEETRNKKALIMDPDHRLLLRNCKPLLQSRNSAVVMGVVQLYYYLAPHTEVNIVAKALIRLTHSHREIQSVVLSTIATLTTRYKGMFEPYLKSFFVRSSDPTHIKVLKLEILTNLATEGNISFILREFQTYVSSPDMEFVAATVQAIGRCASSISEVADVCLNGLVSLLSNKNETVVAESVVVIKKLLQMQITDHKDIIVHMSRLMDTITVPMARASILWLIGEYAEKMTKIAPDVLRKVAKTFSNEEDIVKLQAVNLASKLYLINSKQIKLLVQYVFNLAKYDTNYDIRDRARFLKQLIMPQGETTYLTKHAKKILLAPKPAPVLISKFKDRDRYQLGSLSHYINARTAGYHDLPDFPEEAPDPSVRNVETQVPWQEFSFVKKKKGNIKKKSFYSETESSEAEGAASVSSASEAGKSEDASKASTESEESETESGSEENSESESEESVSDTSASATDIKKDLNSSAPSKSKTNSNVKPKVPNSLSINKRNSNLINSKKNGKKEESAESNTESESESGETASSESEDMKKPIKKKKEPKVQKDVDLLLDLDDFSSMNVSNPVLQPNLFNDVLTPSNASLKTVDIAFSPVTNSIKTVSAVFNPVKQHELLNKYNGKGLCVTYRFTRSPNLFSAQMTTVELVLNNTTDKEIKQIHVPTKKVGSIEIHGFPEIQSIPPKCSSTVSLGIDFKESTQPAKFEIKTSENSHTVTLKAPIGEIIQPVLMSEGEFLEAQGKLKGMNENTGIVDLSSGHADENAIVQYVYEAANVVQVQNNEKESKILRFSSQTLDTKCLVLVSIQVLSNGKASITVNCEKMIIGSMFFKELKEALVK